MAARCRTSQCKSTIRVATHDRAPRYRAIRKGAGTMKFTATLVLLVAMAASVSCGDSSGPPQPVPGALRFDLTSPNTDGALLLHLSGPAAAAASVTAANNAHQLFARAATNGGVNVAVFGAVGTGPLLRIQ